MGEPSDFNNAAREAMADLAGLKNLQRCASSGWRPIMSHHKLPGDFVPVRMYVEDGAIFLVSRFEHGASK